MGTQNRAYRRAPMVPRDGARPRKERSKNRESRETARKKRALANKAVCKLLGEHEWEELQPGKFELAKGSIDVTIEVCKRCGYLRVKSGFEFITTPDPGNWTTTVTPTITWTDDNTTDASNYTNYTIDLFDTGNWSTK